MKKTTTHFALTEKEWKNEKECRKYIQKLLDQRTIEVLEQVAVVWKKKDVLKHFGIDEPTDEIPGFEGTLDKLNTLTIKNDRQKKIFRKSKH